ncbi:predicted protein [Plenodomus lingam JN3]|uniref:Predicted protein n=1 Tax=Leptosphaeria maculans (strain JN3 / isolate v23.1.3 / race Av1-4-5-6-7-8) TaxID=985895 RepID=E4ZJX8_LEPMJ|nr:predicted protein [Plenodomus lingam JN3]CBX91413.1 predicted protein [Plenodomus lingam JN3]
MRDGRAHVSTTDYRWSTSPPPKPESDVISRLNPIPSPNANQRAPARKK